MIVDKFTDDTGATHDIQTYNTYARMPYISEVTSYDSTNKTNAYLYDYLNQSGTIQTNEINGISGYWTLSSGDISSPSAFNVDSIGGVVSYTVNNVTNGGVRAVINLKI